MGEGRWEGGKGEVGKFFWVEKRLKKINNFVQDVFLVHLENRFNDLIVNWCTGGYGCLFITSIKNSN